MSSGVKVDNEVHEIFKKFKMGKLHRFFSLVISKDNTIITLEHAQLKSEDDGSEPIRPLLNLLQDNKARFCFLDHPVEQKSTRTMVDALFFIQFIPDQCPVKDRMMYASSSAAVKKLAEGCRLIQLNAVEDLDEKLLQTKYEK